METLIVSLIIFGIFSGIIIKKYGHNELKQEIGYNIWSSGLFAQLAIIAITIKDL